MRTNVQTKFWLPSIVVVLCLPRLASAQHFDVLAQDVNKRLTTGSADFDTGQWVLGRRVYTRDFDSDFSINDPGFNALASGSPAMPAGAAALPGGTALGWDFLPLKIDGTASNLFYWDGVGGVADVRFKDLPGPDYKLSLFGRFNAVGVEGTPKLVPGDVIDNTASSGSIHRHRFFFLDDGDNNAATVPADGIYLLSLRLTMTGLDSSKPIYLAFGTPGSTLAAIQAAETWVTARVDDLAPDFNADFDRDLDVDGADFLAWQRNLGTASALQIQGDADRDHVVAAGDLAAWKNELGLSLESFAGATSGAGIAAVAEPKCCVLAMPSALLAIAMARLGRVGRGLRGDTALARPDFV